ncbi:MAG: ScyD/ScyE family protein [Kibdelosporangium sp.]
MDVSLEDNIMIARIGRAALTAGALVAALVPATAQASAPRITTLVGGLDNPRGLAFAPDGSVYVAEAGKGGTAPCFEGPEGPACFGTSGAITEVRPGTKRKVLTGLPSIAAPDGTNAIGPADVSFQATLPFLFNLTVGLGADPAIRSTTLPAAEAKNAATLLRSDIFSKHVTRVADLGDHEASANPDGAAPDTNPASVTNAAGWTGGTVVADAGGNSLVRITPNGKPSTLAVFPETQVDAPPFLGLPPGAKVPMQAVPTSVVRGPDGAFYVGQLTGFPFVVGGAKVFRVVPGQQPTVYAEGFTNVIDIAFDRDGALYVLEVAHNGLLSQNPTGALVKAGKKNKANEVVTTSLTSPGGLAIRDGEAYVSNCGTCPGKGELLRIALR